jgi:hypothetical protein
MVTDPPLVEVHWLDHYSLGDDWYKIGHKHEPCTLVAIGYLVSEDDLYYYVTSTYEPATRQYSSGTAVLKMCVTEFHYLEHSKPKRRHVK